MSDILHKIELIELKICSTLDRIEKENALNRASIAEKQEKQLDKQMSRTLWWVGFALGLAGVTLGLAKLIITLP